MSPRVLSLLCVATAFAGFQVTRSFLPARAVSVESARAAGSGDGKTVQTAVERFRAPKSEVSPAGAVGGVPAAGAFKSFEELRQAVVKPGLNSADLRLAMMERINSLGAEDLVRLLDRESRSSDFFRSIQGDFQYAALRLAEVAPEKAAQLWLKHRDSSLGMGGNALLQPWVQKDPQAFAGWVRNLPDEAQKAVGLSMRNMARVDPEQFAGIAAQLANSPVGPMGARGAIDGMRPKEGETADTAKALAFVKGLPEGAMRSSALAALARWPGLDLGAHPDLAAAMADLSPADARRVGATVASSADKLPQGPAREYAYVNQISKDAAKDPQAAARKVEGLSGTADYPAAVRGFVEATATKDPAAAVDWALTIGLQGTHRSAALERAAAEYFRQKPAEARKWVEKAPLSPQEYFMLTGRPR